MKLQPVKFGIAFAISSAALSLVWGAFMFSMPHHPAYMDQHMMRAPMGNWSGGMMYGGMIAGVLIRGLAGGLFGWSVAFFYNALQKGGSRVTE